MNYCDDCGQPEHECCAVRLLADIESATCDGIQTALAAHVVTLAGGDRDLLISRVAQALAYAEQRGFSRANEAKKP